MKGNISQEYLEGVRKIYGQWIRQMREDKGLTQDELAEKMGVSRSTISKVEDGKWNFGVDTITLFGVHLDFYQFFLSKDSKDDLAESMRNRYKRSHDQQ